jgi:hypothetical protein
VPRSARFESAGAAAGHRPSAAEQRRLQPVP